MKKRQMCAAVLLLAALLLSACSAPWSTWTMDEVFPAAVDSATWLTNVETVTITRQSDGSSVLVSGVDVELLYDGFFGVECTRRSGEVEPLYTLSFALAGGGTAADIQIGTYRGTVCCAVEEYRYRPVTIEFDLSYIEGLFGTP